MLRRILLHIQRQPRESREHYALMGAVLGTALVALVWASYVAVFPDTTTYTAALGDSDTAAATEEPTSTSAPLSGFWSQMKEQLAGLRAMGDEVEQALSTTTASEGGGSAVRATTSSTKPEQDNVTITHEPATTGASSTVAASTTRASNTPQQP